MVKSFSVLTCCVMSEVNDKNKIQQLLVDIKRTKGNDKNFLFPLEHILLQNQTLLAESFELVFSLIHVNEIQIQIFLATFIEKICRLNPNCKIKKKKIKKKNNFQSFWEV